jgi:hypothetical protein
VFVFLPAAPSGAFIAPISRVSPKRCVFLSKKNGTLPPDYQPLLETDPARPTSYLRSARVSFKHSNTLSIPI